MLYCSYIYCLAFAKNRALSNYCHLSKKQAALTNCAFSISLNGCLLNNNHSDYEKISIYLERFFLLR